MTEQELLDRLDALSTPEASRARHSRTTSDATSCAQRGASGGVSASSADLLAALSAVLGVDVIAVEVDTTRDGHRTWWLLFAVQPRLWSRPVHSRELRNPRSLNRLVFAWGRHDPTLPPLTAEDGRRALRLMHEHIESTTKSTNTRMEEDRCPRTRPMTRSWLGWR